MKYIFETTPDFRKSFKKIFKKHKSLLTDFENLKEEIQTNPDIGVKLGDGFRKIRLNITDKSKGKSGGARIITHEIIVQIEKEETMSVFFVDIYDKADFDTVDVTVLKEIIKGIREENQ